jgi:hypothetical protein
VYDNFISRFVVILEPPRFIYVARISEPGYRRQTVCALWALK